MRGLPARLRVGEWIQWDREFASAVIEEDQGRRNGRGSLQLLERAVVIRHIPIRCAGGSVTTAAGRSKKGASGRAGSGAAYCIARLLPRIVACRKPDRGWKSGHG